MNRSLYLARLRDARQAGELTPAHYVVGLELLRYANRTGACWPALATLAVGTGLCVRTVSRAIVALRRVGALTWRHRPGARWNRALSNVYALIVPLRVNLGNHSPAIESTRSAPRPIGPAERAAVDALARLFGVSPAAALPWLAIPDAP